MSETTGAFDSLADGRAWVTCARCDDTFTETEWDDRHWGDETDDEFHAGCCPKCGPAEQPDDE